MPTYVYACKNCGHQFEKYQSFSEDSLVTCPDCQQDALRKVFNSVGIVFKGSGFYSTDSSSASTASTAAGDSSSSAAPASSGPDAGGKISAPAPAPAASSSSAAAS